jgi:hypothetical protein
MTTMKQTAGNGMSMMLSISIVAAIQADCGANKRPDAL